MSAEIAASAAGTAAARADTDIAARVIAWQAQHGRRNLPWQQTRDPYRVWLSEIMLQQTQVATVLGYYARFVARFAQVGALAQAPQDEVLALWSGLGYYSRARNLHRCAQRIVSDHGGVFPDDVQALAALPGIGRSTAGAIAAFCFARRAPILDANVRRVLTRLLGFSGDPATAGSQRLLWAHAQALLPTQDLARSMPRYTQGLMDLGATVCTAQAPRCPACPLTACCVAHASADPGRYPVKTRKPARRAESWQLLLLRNGQGQVWLQRRPPAGIWAGMHCPPVFADRAALTAFAATLGAGPRPQQQALPPVLHTLTHRVLQLHPVLLDGAIAQPPAPDGQWLAAAHWPQVGLPAPIRKLLDALPAGRS